MFVDFYEKPKGDALETMKVDTTTLGLTAEQAKEKALLSRRWESTFFKKQVLIDLLRKKPGADGFRERKSFHPQRGDHNVQAYLFDGYWEDIGYH